MPRQLLPEAVESESVCSREEVLIGMLDNHNGLIWRRYDVQPNLRGGNTRDSLLPCTRRNEDMSTTLYTEFLKEAHEIISMFFLHGEDVLHQTAGRGIVVAKVIDHIAITIDGDTLSN
jgi:hypothetical protein